MWQCKWLYLVENIILVERFTQAMVLIPWVCCASENVLCLYEKIQNIVKCFTFFVQTMHLTMDIAHPSVQSASITAFYVVWVGEKEPTMWKSD